MIQIDADCQKLHQLIYLGDYVDRGPDAYEVVDEILKDVEHDGAIALFPRI